MQEKFKLVQDGKMKVEDLFPNRTQNSLQIDKDQSQTQDPYSI